MIGELAKIAGEAADWTVSKMSGARRSKRKREDTKLIAELTVGSLLCALFGFLMMLLEM